MADTKQVLQDFIDELTKSIIETEGILQAQQGALITYKKMKAKLVAKKKGIEEDEKREAEEALKPAKKPRVSKKSGQTPLK